MSRREGMDLVVLVPDLDLSGTVRCLLNRPESIGIRPVSFSVNRHLRREAGCRAGDHAFDAPGSEARISCATRTISRLLRCSNSISDAVKSGEWARYRASD